MEKVAKVLKPDVAKRMNIQMTPWIESDVVKMEDLYTRLSIEKHTNKPHGLETHDLLDYQEGCVEYEKLFQEGGRGTKRILIKGNPGIGKTTFVRKVAWDWAKGICKTFFLVFIISLKLVKPGEPIENVIIQQHASLKVLVKSRKITAATIVDILEREGEKCLLILDGYDEMPQEIGHISVLVKQEAFPDCNILLTSRPNETSQIQKYFMTIASIEGFTKEKARDYIGKILTDKDKRDAVMSYTESNEIEDMWRYPILVMFLCILVNHGDLDIENEKLSLSELYTRLNTCLYRRYIAKNGLEFDEQKRDEILLKLGKVAFDSLNQVKMGYKKSKIIKDVGPEIFQYGILIGDEDRSTVAHEAANILVFFPHRSIQEFLAAKYLVHEAYSGNDTIENLLGKRKQCTFVQKNLMFLTFALDIAVHNLDEPPAKKKCLMPVEKQLEIYILQRFNVPTLELKGFSTSTRTSKVLVDIFSKCSNMENLKLDNINLRNGISMILGTTLPKIRAIHLENCSFDEERSETSPSRNYTTMPIVETLTNFHVISPLSGNIDITSILAFCYPRLTVLKLIRCDLTWEALWQLSVANFKRHLPSIYCLDLQGNPKLSNNIHFLLPTTNKWENLEFLNLVDCNITRKDIRDILLTPLMIHGDDCITPNLREIKAFSRQHIQKVFASFFLNNRPEKSWKITEDKVEDIEAILALTSGAADAGFMSKVKNLYVIQTYTFKEKLISCNGWDSLVSIELYDCVLFNQNLIDLSEANSKDFLPSLTCLEFHRCTGGPTHLRYLFSSKWKRLKSLTAKQCGLEDIDLKGIGDANALEYLPSLEEIVLHNNPDISTNLKLLLSSPWTKLIKLGLNECNIFPVDLEALSEANANNFLPKLSICELNFNDGISGHVGNLVNSKWSNLRYFSVKRCRLLPDDLQALADANVSRFLPQIQSLLMLGNGLLSGNISVLLANKWPLLEFLDLRTLKFSEQDGLALLEALEDRKLPKLKTVKALSKNISFELLQKLTRYITLE